MPGSLAIGAPRATETPVVECIAKSPDERTTLFRVRSNETRIYYSLKRYHIIVDDCCGFRSMLWAGDLEVKVQVGSTIEFKM